MGDEELIERLSAVAGIGRWTAEMFLIFQLGRLDVWPAATSGAKGYGAAWASRHADAQGAHRLRETFRPYARWPAWYCWRAVDTSSRLVVRPAPAPASCGEARHSRNRPRPRSRPRSR